MGKLIYLMNVSLDGFIETPDHSLDWATIDDEIHGWFNERTRASATSIYGRRMYDTMTAYWPTADQDPNATPVMLEYATIWNAMPKVVFSHSLESADYGFRLVRGDVGEVLRDLRAEVDGDIDVSGPNIASQFIERDLVDAYQLVVHPVAIGAGTPFFPANGRRLRLRQTAIERVGSGVVMLTYERA
ncbi:MAG TPA: dihydrofolate reductase family protein [Candidatus Limnocylindrales bacterium]